MNHLIHETSPYLLQHAHNPVEWYAWKPEAFERAKREDKPILVSIGYSTCHWCHVMERESFENEDIAAIMNEYFINIKVDREERPDVDHIYMEACQVISGNGGWPLNCFLTPDGRPFFAGTYYPTNPAYGRPSWVQLLRNLADAFYNKRDVVEDQANRLTEIIKNSDKTYVKNKAENISITEGVASNNFIDKSGIDNIYTALRERFDTVEGGFGGAPKFPGTMCIQFLLEYYFYTKNHEALDHAVLSLNKMIQGGIYDQLGGGFARYATDREWLIPHFEKMLYDNALLVNVISEAYKLTKKDIFKETIEETLEFVAREMSHTEGGVFSAYDADSEGVEGKFYVWDKKEIEDILGENAELFCQFYDVTEGGNWEHKNILWRQLSYEEFSIKNKIPIDELKKTLKACRTQLFTARSTRIWPGLDDKILLSWNALMISAYAKAYEALGDASYREIAERNLNFILKNFKKNDAFGLFHTFKNKKAQYDAFLEDYAFLIEALLDVYGVTFNKTYFTLACGYADYVLAHFYDDSSGLFYFTSDEQTDVIVRKKDLYDSAMPSGNSTMAKNLLRLSIMLDDTHYKSIALRMLQAIAEMVEKYPSSFAKWASTLLSVAIPPAEVAVIGESAFDLSFEINRLFLPNKIVMASVEEDEYLPLLAGRATDGVETLIYVCRNYTCQMPVKTIEEMEHLMTKLNPL